MKELIIKFIFNEKIKYIFWGIMTTLVYFIARFIPMSMMSSTMIPVAIAQIISIVFAFIVNKYLVFNHDTQSKNASWQLLIFLIGRAIGAVLDFLLTYLMITRFYKFFINAMKLNCLNYHSLIFRIGIINKLVGSPILMNKFVSVILIQIIIIIINYIISKYFAFK